MLEHPQDSESIEEALLQRLRLQKALKDNTTLLQGLTSGHLALWLNPATPLMLLGCAGEVGEGYLCQGAFFAARAVARGWHLAYRTPLSSHDNYALLRHWTKKYWESKPLHLAHALQALYPWEDNFLAEDYRGELVATNFELIRSKAFSEKIRLMVQITLASVAPLKGRKHPTGAHQLYEQAQGLELFNTWAESPSPEGLCRLVLSSTPFAYDIGWNQSRWAHNLLVALQEVPWCWVEGVYVDQIRAAHPACPLLKYFPDKDLVSFDEYATMEPKPLW